MAGFPIGGICGSAVKPVYFGKVKKKLKKFKKVLAFPQEI
jgi:hypothetical protein